MPVTRGVQDLGGDAARAQPRRVGRDVAAQPQRALLPHERLAGPRRPRVPARAGGDGVGDLGVGRVQVAEAARGAGGLAGARLAALEHHDGRALPGERIGGGEADDPAADDRPRPPSRRRPYAMAGTASRGRVRHASPATTSASAATTAPKISNVVSSPSGVISSPARIAGTEIDR